MDATKGADAHDITLERPIHENFNQFGEYMDRYVVTYTGITSPILEEQVLPPHFMFRRTEHITVEEDDKQPSDGEFPIESPLQQPRVVF